MVTEKTGTLLQREEYVSIVQAHQKYNQMTGGTELDSIRARHDYETSVRVLVTALQANGRFPKFGLNSMAKEIYQVDNHRWWHDLITGEKLNRNIGELLMLIVSEIAEGMEGHRKNLMDDHLPHRKMLEVELADAVIRILDLAGSMNLDLDGAVAEKRAYNAQRADHKAAARLAPDGKKF